MANSVGTHVSRFVLVAALLVLVNFLLPRLLPGSPMRGAAADAAIAFLPAAARAELRRTYGLDRPLSRQFVDYLRGLARGELGRSLATHRPVAAMIAERAPWTLLLVGGAVVLSGIAGAALGTSAAWRPAGMVGRVVGPLVIAIGALPEFLVALGLIVVFGAVLRVFPAGGAATPFRAVPGLSAAVGAVGDVIWHAALPSATLVIGLVPAFFLLSRNALTPVLAEPYLRTALGKGLPGRRLLYHAWRNAAPAVLTLLALRLAFVVTGAAVVERIFAYPGLGLLLFEAVAMRDYPVIQGVFLIASGTILAVGLALDLLAAVLDPRLRDRV